MKIIGKQTIKLKSSSAGFKNYFKQLAVPFTIYDDFESFLKGVKSNDNNNASYTENNLKHIPCSFAYKVVCLDNKINKKSCSIRGRNGFIDSLKQFLKK